MMNQGPLAPGEVRIEPAGITPPAEKPSRKGLWFLGVFVVLLLLIAKFTSSPGAGGSADDLVEIPAAPTPPGQYAVVAPSVEAGAAADHLDVGFVHERLEILRVPPHTIPGEDLVRAVYNGRNEVTPNIQTAVGRKIAVASRFRTEIQDAVYATNVAATGHLEASTLPPYVFHGDINITCGDLTNDDHGYVAALLQDGSLSRASIHLADGTPRGPPVRVRRVYVMGEIVGLQGPEQFKRSVLHGEALDLGPSAGSSDAYAEALKGWNEKIVALEASLHVPAQELRKFGGSKVRVRAGHVSEVFDENGNPKKSMEEIERELEKQHPEGRTREAEHALEEALPHAVR